MSALYWRRYFFLSLAVGWMGLIFYLSSQSDPVGVSPGVASVEGRTGARVVASVAHIVEFGTLALFLRWGLASRRPGFAVYAVTLAFTMAFAVSDEVHQSFTPGRVSSAGDVALDAAGAVLALGLWKAVELIVARPRLRRGRSPTI